jgi:chromosomal replication initiator protein
MAPKRVLWKQCLELVEGQVPPESYSTWFSPTQPHELTEDCLTVEVPNHFYKKCLQENYSELIESSLKSLTGRPIKLSFLVGSDSPPKEDSLDTAVDGLRNSLKTATGTDIRRSPTSTIDQKYRFSNFVVGTSNQFAHAAAEAVARTPGGF